MKILIWFMIFLCPNLDTILSDNVIDMDDILSEDFMPGTLLVLENPRNGPKNYFNESVTVRLDTFPQVLDGSYNNAMQTMDFHRSMMNKYLCRSYVAEQIINDMTLSRMKRRMGVHSPDNKISKVQQNPAKPSLLADEGSSNYKDWLSKSTTLEDIYRHYNDHISRNRIDEDDADKDDDLNEDYDTHITGYAYNLNNAANHGQSSPAKLGHSAGGGVGGYYGGGGGGSGYSHPSVGVHHSSGGGGGYPYSQGGGGGGAHSGYGGGGGGYGGGGGFSGHTTGGGHSGYGGGGGGVHIVHEPEHVYHEQPKPHYIVHETHSTKGHDLSDLFEIALTALAFLAFKTFLIHVLMCLTMTTSNSTTVVSMMPMSMSPSAAGMTMTGGGSGGDAGGTAGGDNMGSGSTATGDGDATENSGGTEGGEGGMPMTGGEGENTGDGGGMTTSNGGGGDMMENDGGAGTTDGGDGGDGGEEGGTGSGSDTGMMMTMTGSDGGGTAAAAGDDGDGGTEGGTENTDDAAADGDGADDGVMATATGTGGGAADTAAGSTAESDTGSGGTGTGRDNLKERSRRDVPSASSFTNRALNELARRVLISIEAALVFEDDEGTCLRKTLCESNRYSRELNDRSKILIPVWSLGMSWISGRLSQNVNSATSMLDSLKASILGLGKANCEIIYQDCDLHGRMNERRKRKKRQVVE